MHLSSTGTAIITRPRGQSAVLRQTLARHHVETLEFPLLEIAPAKDDAPLARALAMLEQYALVIFPHRMRYIMRLRICRMETGRARCRLAWLGPAARERSLPLGLPSRITA